MDLNIKYDPATISRFNSALKSYVTDLGMQQKDVIKQWSGNLAIELMKETPPFTGGRSASNGQDARARGVASLEENLKKAIRPVDSMFDKKNIKNDSLRKILKQRNKQKLENFMQHSGYASDWKVVDFDKKYHTDKRPTIFRKIKSQHVLTFNKNSWKSYLDRLKTHVGYMKAGWAVAAVALGKKVPNWISNNIPRADGAIKTIEKESSVSYTIENSSPTIERYSGRFNHAISWMFDKMKKDIEIRLAYLRKKHGK